MAKQFPPGFIWGTASAAYQIEGAVDVDGRGPTIWDIFSHRPGRTTNGDTGDIACDHYHRYPEDIALMRRLGVGAYRLSTAWSRILPEGHGAINRRGLDFYDRVIDLLLHEGIEPWICLHHWDMPVPIEERGGWRSRETPKRLADFASIVARYFGDRVRRFVPVCEPAVIPWAAYNVGRQAPGQQSAEACLQAIHNLNLAHGWTVSAVRAAASGAELGNIISLSPVHVVNDDAAHREALVLGEALWRHVMVDPLWLGRYPEAIAARMEHLIRQDDLRDISQKLDFFGLNHYARIYVAPNAEASLGVGESSPPPGVPRTDNGLQIDPSALTEQLLEVKNRYGNPPIYITENGAAFPDMLRPDRTVVDDARIAFLQGYIAAAHDAIAQGVDLRGYFIWSLLDNFEWNSGYSKRFGLVYVDYPTLQRIPKKSFDWFRALVEANALTERD
jgi:beta-glucosidase